MKNLKTIFACLLMAVLSIGQVWAVDPTISWDFKTLQTTSGTQSGITWETGKTGSANATTCNGTNGLVLYGVTSGGGYFQTTSAISGTITNVNIVSANKKNTPKYTVYCSTDGSTWDKIATDQTAGTKDHAVTGSYTYVKVANTTAATAQLGVASITVTYTPSGGGSTPTLSVDPTVIDFGTVDKNASVEAQDVTVTFENLTGSVTYSGLSGAFAASGTIAASGNKITITPNTANTGNFQQTLTVQSAADSKSAEVTVKMNVVEPFDGLKLTFDVSSNPGEWPTANSTTTTNYTYTLNEVDYTFALNNVKCNPGYLMLTSVAKLGLPAISGYKLVKIEATNSSGCSTSTQVSVSSSDATKTDVTGGTAQTWGTTSTKYTYNLSGTEENTMYYLWIANKNCQLVELTLYYEEAEAATVATPVISGTESFLTSTEVSIACTTDGATVYYTTDGTDPKTSESKQTYSAAFTLTNTATVRAIATKDAAWSSEATSKTFTKILPLTVASALTEEVGSGKYVEGVISSVTEVSISNKNATYVISDISAGLPVNEMIVYRGKYLNGADFTSTDQIHVGDKVVVSGSISQYKSVNQMAAGNQIESITPAAVVAPVFSPDGGGFMGETDVTITCATGSSTIYYTLDGTNPTKLSTLYEGAIHLDATTTITAIAYVGEESSLVVAKEFTLTAPMTVAEALAALDSENPINNVAVSGIISTAPTANPSSGKLTYFISDDGSASDELEVYKGFGVAGASFSDKTDLQVGDQVTVFGNLTIFNTTKEFAEGNRLLAFNRPVVPSISADPVAVDAAAHAGQSVTITYENWGAVSVADAEATLWDNEACDEAFSGDWISNVDVAANFESVSFDIAANTGAARTAYMKIYAHGDDATTEAEKVIAISQEAYVAPAEPASLPFAFDGGKADIATTQGMSQDGLDNSDYASSPKLKFKAEGAWVIIEIASAPGKLTYDIKGNSFSGGTFKVQESADGSDYSDVATYTELGGTTQNEEKTLDQDTRFVKFIYTTKDAGNVALGNIAIAEYVAPAAVETPAFSPAGGEYAGAQSVELSCTTEGAAIYYTTNGDDPDNTKTLYEGAINVDATMTIKAIAYKGDDHSEIASATYTITAPLTDYYEKVTSGDVAEGTYLIVYEAGNVAFNGGLETLDAVSNTIDVEITNDHKIGVTTETEAATFYIDPTAGSIQAANGKYIGQGSDANGMAVSDNALVNTLSIDGDGNAVVVSAGGAYLRYNSTSGQERFRYFKSSSYTSQKAIQLYKLANEVIKPASGLAWDPADDIELTVGDAFTAPTLLNPNTIPAGDITIESSNELVATVSAGVVSLVENATGTTTITATYTGETYKPITVSYKIKVNPAYSIYVQPSLNVNFGSVEKDAALPADKTITVTLNNVAAATAVLGGTNPEAFSIDPATLTESGNITISVVSSATVANYAATLTISDEAGNAESKVVNLSFSVTEPAGEETPVSTTSKWIPATAIEDGMQVLITGVKSDVTYAMGEQKSNNRTAVAGTLDEGVFTPGENTMSFTLVATGAANTYYIKTSNNQYLYNASTSGNSYLRTKAEQENVSWTITLDGDGNAVITSVENTNRTLMRLNPNGQNNPLFNCYASGQNAIKLYVPQTPEPPTPSYTTVRTGLNAGDYYTMCLDKAVTAVQGGSIWRVVSKADGSSDIILEEVTGNLDAGRPYIFLASAADLEVAYTGDAVGAPITEGNNGLVGSFEKVELAQSPNTFIIYNNALYFVNSAKVYVGAYRAYLNMLDVPDYNPANHAPGRRRVTMAVHGPQTATGIEDLNASEKPMKMMINGQIFILRGEKMYDTTGRLVK